MNIKIVLSIFFLLFSTTVNAQKDSISEGIRFLKELSWVEILKKAKDENRFIFLDCYTTWCSPCKQMSKNIFPLQEVGKMMNKNFINVAVQMDSTGSDNSQVKDWYRDAKQILRQYHVNAFPTYLFFSPNGELVHRAQGACDATTFISTASFALQNQNGNNYQSMIEKYRKGNRDDILLRNLSLAAEAKGDHSLAYEVGNQYINGLRNVFTKENLSYITRFTKSLKDRGFKIFNQYPERVADIMGASQYFAVDRAIAIIIQEDELFDTSRAGFRGIPNWAEILKAMQNKYHPTIARKTVMYFKYNYYEKRELWDEYVKSVIEYIQDYYSEESFTQGLNYIAWNIFLHSNDSLNLQQALSFSQRTLIYELQDPYNMDTYANILYKLGRKKEAIKLETLALQLVSDEEKKNFVDNLSKMKMDD